MGLELRTNRVKNSRYVLIPKSLARRLDIRDQSIFRLTIEESDGIVRLVYAHDNGEAKYEHDGNIERPD